jgi:NAD(P)-dependent dehydrogenase (short-subunit alcohol dehydrogenase family)
MSHQDWELLIAVNLSAPFYFMQASLPHILKTRGAIVNGSSPAGELARPYSAAYTASKAGLTQMTRSLAAEFIGQNIRINMVSYSGIVMSAASASNLPPDLDPKLFHKAETAARAPIALEKVADMFAFLASDAASGFHGSCVTIDNGVSLGV